MFSIIVPVYNVQPYLRQCLDSLLAQTYDDREIIVIDDGSTDGSSEICDEYAACARVTVLHQKNMGLSAARNAGMARASGEWLVFVDGDDWVDADMLEILQGHILATNADFYRLSVKGADENGNFTNTFPVTKSDTIISFPDEKSRFGFYFHLFMRTVRVWGGAYRRSIVEKYRLRFVDTEQIYAEDLLFNFQYLLHAKKIAYLKDMPYYYRKRPGSLTDVTPFEKRLPRVATLGEITYESLDEENFPLFKRQYFYIYFKLLDRFILRDATELDDAQMRHLLDDLEKRPFHRNLMNQIRRHGSSFKSYTRGRQWYREDFGTEKALRKQEKIKKFLSIAKKSPLAWRLWFIYQNARYALRGTNNFPPVFFRDAEHKVAYLSMPKVACSSISVSMLRRDDIPDDYTVFSIRRPFCSSVPAGDGWFTFTFVRNPFARLVSCYESKFHTDPLRNRNAMRRKSLDFDGYLYGYMKKDEGFSTFINQIVSIPWRLDNNHFCSQYRKITDKNGKLLVDYIGKFEHLVEDYELVRARGDFAPLKIYNKSRHGDWRDYYTTDLVKKVYRKYSVDVKFLGYEQEYKDLLEYCRRKGR